MKCSTYITNLFDFAAAFADDATGQALMNQYAQIQFAFLLSIRILSWKKKKKWSFYYNSRKIANEKHRFRLRSKYSNTILFAKIQRYSTNFSFPWAYQIFSLNPIIFFFFPVLVGYRRLHFIAKGTFLSLRDQFEYSSVSERAHTFCDSPSNAFSDLQYYFCIFSREFHQIFERLKFGNCILMEYLFKCFYTGTTQIYVCASLRMMQEQMIPHKTT